MRVLSPTAHIFGYPLNSPSARFNTTNKAVRDLALQYEELPPDLRDAWDFLHSVWGWSADCFEAVFGVNPLALTGDTGKQIYVAVNMSRYVQGLAFTDIAPVVFTSWDFDQIQPGGSDPHTVVWSGRPTTPEGDFYATVSACGLNHAPESGPALSRYSFAFGRAVNYAEAFSVLPVYDVFPGLLSVPFASLAVRISDAGSAPFVGGRVGFTPPP